MVIIGGGVISVELAFAMAPLGTKVTIIEVAPDILLTEDPDARKIIKKQLQKKQIQTIIKARNPGSETRENHFSGPRNPI